MTAVLYGVASVLIVGFVAKGQWDEREAELHPREYTVEVPDGRVFVVRAQFGWEAQSAVEEYATAHPVALSDAEVFGASKQASAVRPAKGDSDLLANGAETPPWLDYAADAAPSGAGEQKPDLSNVSDPDLMASLHEPEPSKGRSSETANGDFDGSEIFADHPRTSNGKSTAPDAAISEQEEFELRRRAEAKAARAAAPRVAKPESSSKKAVTLTVQKYEHPRTIAAVLQAGAKAAMWCALVYAAFWAMFRGIRWVALGFMDGRTVGPVD